MNIAVEPTGRAKRLKVATKAAHQRLDQRIMAADPFDTEARYGQFALVQHAFHRDIEALYDNALLARLLPDLSGRRRLHKISQDIADLGFVSPVYVAAPVFGRGLADIPTALGWLYVAEGSNLGAAFLLKEAAKLGLSENFGARHLEAASDGRGLSWRSFTAALDAIEFSDPEEVRVVAGAQAAFARVLELVEDLLPINRA